MSAIKKFFENRKLSKKFKQAGEGHRLDEARHASRSQSSSSRASSSSERRPPSQAGNRAAEAALARLQQDQQLLQKKPSSKTATWKGSKPDEPAPAIAIDYERMKSEMLADARVCKAPTRQLSTPASPEAPGCSEASPIRVEDTTPYICPVCPMSLPKVDMLSHLEECLPKDLNAEPLMISVAMIHSLNKDKSMVEVCIQTLCKYLQNIIDHPAEEKYRKIRANNKVFQEKVGCLKGTDEFLTLACGFKVDFSKVDGKDDEKFYVLESDDVEKIDELSVAKGILQEAESLKATLDRNVKVYSPSSNAAKIVVPDSFYAITSAEIQKEQESKTIIVEKEKLLRTKAMREAEKDKRKRVYRYSVIRVKLPDGVLLQGTFLAREALQEVCDFIREHIQMDWLPFSLTSPIGEKHDDLTASLSSLSLAPAALLICQVDADIIAELSASASVDGGPVRFLKDEVLAFMQPLD